MAVTLSRSLSRASILVVAACMGEVTGIKDLPPAPVALWTATGAVSLDGRPLVFGNSVYVQSGSAHSVSRVDRNTGSRLWTRALTVTRPERGGSGLTMAGGRLIVGDADVFGLDPETGDVTWRFVPMVGNQPGWRRLSSDGTTVFCGGGHGGYLYAVDGATGVQRWATKVSPDSDVGVASPVVRDGVVYSGYIDDQVAKAELVSGGVIAVNAVTGAVLWNRTLPKPVPSLSNGTYTVAVGNGRVFSWAKDGHFYVLDAGTGDILKTLTPDQFAVPGTQPWVPDAEKVIALAGDTVLVVSVSSGTVAAFVAPDMRRLWIKASVDGSPRDIVAASPYAYVISSSGGPSIFRIADGVIAFSQAGRDIQAFGAPTPDGDRFYVGGGTALYAWRWPTP